MKIILKANAHSTENKNKFCNLYNTTIRCCRANIVRHSQRVKHIKNVNFPNQNLDNINNVLHTNKIKRAEI